MAHDPMEHAMDSSEFHVFDALLGGFSIPLPEFYIFGYHFQVTKFMVLELVAAGLIILIYVPVARWARTGAPPRGFLWNTFESILTFIRDQVAKPCIGEHDADKYVPFLWTLFLFILCCNLLGMLPYMGSPTASISVTAALALCSFLVIHGAAIAKMGPLHYLKSYAPHMEVPFGMGYVLIPMLMVIEVLGQFIKAFVLAVRLFANMFAGHLVVGSILFFIYVAKTAAFVPWFGVSLISVMGVVALSLLELFVAFLQSYIFVFLTALFMGMALHPSH